MASYLPNLTDTIPQAHLFKPDWGSINYYLQNKESQYKQGFDKISSLYGTLFNSPMLRDSDIARRDQFFKQTQETIKKISGLDLSLAENVQAASQIFQPLIEDQNITSDISRTAGFMNEQARMEGMRNSRDRKEGDPMYWTEGEEDLNNWAKDYKKTNDKEALDYPTARYVPSVPMTDEIWDKLAKAGFKTERATVGNYFITTYKNGTMMVPSLFEYLRGTVGEDPRYKDMMGVLARNQRHSWIANNLHNYGGDELRTEDAYFGQALHDINTRQRQMYKTLGFSKKQIDASLTLTEENQAKNRTAYSSDDPVVKDYLSFKDQQDAINKAYTSVGQALDGTANMFADSRVSKRHWIDSGIAQNRLLGELMNIAHGYANMTSGTEIKENPYGMEAVKHHNALELEGIRQKGALARVLAKGALANVEPTRMKNVSGDLAGGASETFNQMDRNKTIANTDKLALSSSQFKVMNDVYDNLAATYNSSSATPAQKAEAKEKLDKWFPKAALDQANYQPGALADTPFFTDPRGYNTIPAFYGAIKSNILNNHLFNENHKDITEQAKKDIQVINRIEQVRSSDQDVIRKSNLTLARYLKTTGNGDYTMLFEPNGDLRPPSRFSDQDWYKDALNDFSEQVNASWKNDWKGPIYKVPGGGNTGGIATGIQADRLNPHVPGDGQRLALETADNIVAGKVLGYTPGTGATSEVEYNTNPEIPLVIESFLNTYKNEMGVKGKPTAFGEIYAHPISKNNSDIVAVTIKPGIDFLEKHSKKIGARQVDWTKYADGITVHMRASDAPEFFSNYKRGPIAKILRNGQTVSIDDYKNAGRFYMNYSGDHYTAVWDRIHFDGKDKVTVPEINTFSADEFDPDLIYNFMQQQLPTLDKNNKDLERASSKKDVPSLLDYYNQLKESQMQLVPGDTESEE